MIVSDVKDKPCILFVDDEMNVLVGLKRALHAMRDEWDMAFANSGAEALQMLEARPADMVVSDLRMPRMDGVDLLNAVKLRYPKTIRFVLSGQADRFMILRCAGPSHQFLVKPCSAEDLVKAARRSFSLRDLLARHELARFLEDDVVLPDMPAIYADLMRALQSRDSSMVEIARIIDRDADMAAKMLRLVNSAFFVYIESIQQALSYLGAEAISAIALASALYEPFLGKGDDPFGIQESYDHSITVGATAGRWIAKNLKDRKRSEEATMAGMTHDIGKLVVIRSKPDLWAQAARHAQDNRLPMHAAEREVLGTTHAEIGAYLLHRWGIADNIVEAVAYHHHPSASIGRERNSLFAVHAANALSHKWSDPSQNWRRLLDAAYVAATDPAWSLEQFEADAGRA
jgi:putative nucleotidyltransferase with HDIG domain